MEKVELTVSIEEPRLDVLNYCLKTKGSTTVQNELEKKLEDGKARTTVTHEASSWKRR